MKKIHLILIIIITLLMSNITASATKEQFVKEVDFYKCIDGDTAKVKIDGDIKTLRFLAIDTPESKHPNKKAEPFGKEASNYTCSKLEAADKITIEYDKASDRTDKYNRELVWIFTDGELLQKYLIKRGYAKVAYLYGDYKYTNDLKKSEKEAQKKRLGIWGDHIDYERYIAYIVLILIVLGIIFKKVNVKLIYKEKRKKRNVK